MSTQRKAHRAGAVALTAGLVAVMAACGQDGTQNADDDTSEIVIWTDATRQAGFEQYAEEHPDDNIRVVLIPADAGYISTQIQLANKAGSGWPDAVFVATAGELAQLASEDVGYAAPLQDLVPQDVQAGFLESSIANCTFGDDLVCLQNDVGATVLWYNKTLMDEFGYEVPTTWEQYQEIGLRVASEHPGYVVGFGAEDAANGVFYASSKCPQREVIDENTVRIDLSAPECTRVAELLQPLVDNGTLPLVGPNDPSFIELGKQNKILMMPGAGYYGDFVFKTNYETPEGSLAAAPLPMWEGEDKAYSGLYGGGVFAISSHASESKQQKAADIITWMATNTEWQVAQPTYPAYAPAAEEWGAQKAKDPFYASDPFPAMNQMANSMTGQWNFVRYQTAASQAYTQHVVAAVKAGDTLKDGLADMEEALVEAAEAVGYTVVQ